jgi:pimeloyl-ACP methyl ester carboxylesterase
MSATTENSDSHEKEDAPARVTAHIQTKTKKVLFTGALAALATILAKSAIAYRIWQRKELAHIQAGSSMIETAMGPVEYRMSGEGPAVVIVHGSPGGYDQAFAFSRLIDSQQYKYIAPSRPGYLRTPLTSGASPEEQADLYAALLDALEIERATIIGISGGGPSSLQFALRHPERCHSLVMISGVAQHYSEQELKQTRPAWQRPLRDLYERLTMFDPLLYFLYSIIRLLPGSTSTAELLQSVTLYHLRKDGYKNDMQQFEAIKSYPLEKITVPTLVVHGTSDDEVPFDHARTLERMIPHVKLLAIEGGGHMVFYTHARTVMPILRDFLADR